MKGDKNRKGVFNNLWAALLLAQGLLLHAAGQAPDSFSPEPCPSREAAIDSMLGRAKVIPTLTNSLGMVFVRISRSDALFCMWDTCVWEYAVFAKDKRNVGHSWREPGFDQSPTHPVVNVSWEDAKAFCRWLTKIEQAKGIIQKGQYYRLPTDAEWSEAAGLEEPTFGEPTTRRSLLPDTYAWGNGWPPVTNWGNYSQVYNCDSFLYTSPVGTFEPNKYGLYDISGNVGQWVEDRYGNDHPDCRAWRNTATWRDTGTHMLSLTCRGCNWPDNPYNALGFRIVLAAKPIKTKPTVPRKYSETLQTRSDFRLQVGCMRPNQSRQLTPEEHNLFCRTPSARCSCVLC